MNDVDVLKKLNLLRGLKSPESEEFIERWIKDLTMNIAQESEANIGFGNGIKTLKKYIKINDKSNNGFGGMLCTSKKGVYILTNKHFAVKAKSTFKMPVIDDQTATANQLLDVIDSVSVTHKSPVPLPTRAELDLEIKKWKAAPKESRTAVPQYDFGEGLPMFNAEYLFDLLALVPMANKAYVDTKAKQDSKLYIKYTPFEIVVMPIRKRG